MNYQLKTPLKTYIWSVKQTRGARVIMLTDRLAPKDFHFQVGQFLDSKISEMKLIGHRYVKDHYGNDIEEVFTNSGKLMKQEIVDLFNSRMQY